MFVTEEHRGTGVATQLVENVVEYGKSINAYYIRLFTAHELEQAHSFYEKVGFFHGGKTYQYYLH